MSASLEAAGTALPRLALVDDNHLYQRPQEPQHNIIPVGNGSLAAWLVADPINLYERGSAEIMDPTVVGPSPDADAI